MTTATTSSRGILRRCLHRVLLPSLVSTSRVPESTKRSCRREAGVPVLYKPSGISVTIVLCAGNIAERRAYDPMRQSMRFPQGIRSRQIASRHRVAAAKANDFHQPSEMARARHSVAIGARVRCSDKLCHREGRKVEMKLGVALPLSTSLLARSGRHTRIRADGRGNRIPRIWPHPITFSASMSQAAPIGATATRLPSSS